MAIKCVECGKFIGYRELLSRRVQFDYTPDSAYGHERCDWTCPACLKIAELAKRARKPTDEEVARLKARADELGLL